MREEERGKPGFTIRALVIALALTVFLLATSSYIALKIGALPWPIIFSVIAASAILKIFSRFTGKTNIHEMNVASAGGTIGGLLASGVVFTIPGILLLQQKGIEIILPDFWSLALISVTAGALGVFLSIPARKVFVDEENLPFPSGKAGAEVLKASEKLGKNTLVIAVALTVTGVFVLFRDMFFPAGFTLPIDPSIGLAITLFPMPLAIGIGYILGHKASVNSWFFGSVIGWFIIIPVLAAFYGIEAAVGAGIVKDLGMGIVLGAGIGFFFSYIIPRARRIFAPMFRWNGAAWYEKMASVFSIIAIVVLTFSGVHIIASVIAVAGTWVMVTVASMMTGETDINPLEQFGIIIGLLVLGFFALVNSPIGYYPAFLVVCFVSIATAMAGDIGHDYKSAKIIGTRVLDIVKVDLLAAIVAGALAPLVLFTIIGAYSGEFFTQAMPAPQAQLVAGSIFGFANPDIFYLGFAVAFIWVVIETFSKKKAPIIPMVFGIGLFLGPVLGILLAIGGAIRYYVDKKMAAATVTTGIIIASGIMGGEGIAGFGAASLIISGMPAMTAMTAMFVVFIPALIISLIYFWRRKG